MLRRLLPRFQIIKRPFLLRSDPPAYARRCEGGSSVGVHPTPDLLLLGTKGPAGASMRGEVTTRNTLPLPNALDPPTHSLRPSIFTTGSPLHNCIGFDSESGVALTHPSFIPRLAPLHLEERKTSGNTRLSLLFFPPSSIEPDPFQGSISPPNFSRPESSVPRSARRSHQETRLGSLFFSLTIVWTPPPRPKRPEPASRS